MACDMILSAMGQSKKQPSLMNSMRERQLQYLRVCTPSTSLLGATLSKLSEDQGALTFSIYLLDEFRTGCGWGVVSKFFVLQLRTNIAKKIKDFLPRASLDVVVNHMLITAKKVTKPKTQVGTIIRHMFFCEARGIAKQGCWSRHTIPEMILAIRESQVSQRRWGFLIHRIRLLVGDRSWNGLHGDPDDCQTLNFCHNGPLHEGAAALHRVLKRIMKHDQPFPHRCVPSGSIGTQLVPVCIFEFWHAFMTQASFIN
jgi:hypothetical protein